jgi:peptidoglycan/xylan/chitin deacetylase (PgdA/CDA1 family)
VLRVITYHRIAAPEETPDLDPGLVSATPESFRRQMLHLRRWYNPVGIERVVEAFTHHRPLPPRAVHVTFDDAYLDFRDVAWPILRELDVPVTLFVPTAYPGDPARAYWWDELHRARSSVDGRWGRIRATLDARGVRVREGSAGDPDLRAVLRLLPYETAASLVEGDGLGGGSNGGRMSHVIGWDDLRMLRSEGVAFGVHTRHHVALPWVEAERIREEIRRSLDDVKQELGDGPHVIAYPYGLCNATVARIAKEEGCVVGFTGEDGLNRPGVTDPLRLYRSNITRRTSPGVFAVRMLPWCATVDRWRHRRLEVLANSHALQASRAFG